MFKCKVCLEKDKRIAELLDQVVYLREITNPGKLTITMPSVHVEADRILTNGTDLPQPTAEDEAIEAEATRIFAGTY